MRVVEVILEEAACPNHNPTARWTHGGFGIAMRRVRRHVPHSGFGIAT